MTKKLICLGRFATHSFYPWVWRRDAPHYYYRECSFFACTFLEKAETLVPAGLTAFVGDQDQHAHDWDVWKSTEMPDGTYKPPWLYKRQCRTCLVEQLTVNLKPPD